MLIISVSTEIFESPHPCQFAHTVQLSIYADCMGREHTYVDALVIICGFVCAKLRLVVQRQLNLEVLGVT